MSIKTTRWDSAEHLQTEEDVALYLQACMEEGGDDPTFTTVAKVAEALGSQISLQLKARAASSEPQDTPWAS